MVQITKNGEDFGKFNQEENSVDLKSDHESPYSLTTVKRLPVINIKRRYTLTYSVTDHLANTRTCEIAATVSDVEQCS